LTIVMPEATDGFSGLIEQILFLASDLSTDATERMSKQLEMSEAGDWPSIRHRLDSAVSSPRFRDSIHILIERWRQQSPAVTPASVALALRTAVAQRNTWLQQSQVELVWTGPDSGVVPLRRTDQALLEIIDRAQHDLLIVAFAVYRIPRILSALNQAMQRGVQLRIVLESPEESDRVLTLDGLRALGPDIIESASIYGWPRDQRPVGPAGRQGTLHVKCAIGDADQLLISSANLTGSAMTVNMEMGVRVNGSDIPRRVRNHFERLIEMGILRPYVREDRR